MKKQLKKVVTGAMIVGAMAATQAQATLLIDNFTQFQTVTDIGNDATPTSSTVALTTGTDLTGATRTLSALATGGLASQNEQVIVDSAYLFVSNSTLSNGTAFVDYTFNSTDFSASGTAILLKVLAIDLGVQVNMSVNNGAASSGYQAFNGIGDFFKTYSSFNGYSAAEFSNVTNLRLDFKGVQAWDGQFQLLTSDTPPKQVPVPATIGLVGIGLAALGFRKKLQG
jgi:hypothetical protein